MKFIALFVLSLVLLSGCQNNDSLAVTGKHVTIKVGESGEDFAKRYPEFLDVDRQPAGVDFYRTPPGGRKLLGEKGGEAAPYKGEIDIMKYYTRNYYAPKSGNLSAAKELFNFVDGQWEKNPIPASYNPQPYRVTNQRLWGNSKATAHDVRLLVWLSRITF